MPTHVVVGGPAAPAAKLVLQPAVQIVLLRLLRQVLGKPIELAVAFGRLPLQMVAARHQTQVGKNAANGCVAVVVCA